MIISVQGMLVDTTKIYQIGPVVSERDSIGTYKFTIHYLNGQKETFGRVSGYQVAQRLQNTEMPNFGGTPKMAMNDPKYHEEQVRIDDYKNECISKAKQIVESMYHQTVLLWKRDQGVIPRVELDFDQA